MRVSKTGYRFDLTQEAVRTNSCGQLRVQDLDRDLAVVLQVLGEEDGRHPAAAELGFDGIPVGEGGLQALEQIEATLGEPLPDGYASDVCLAARPWVADLAGSLEEGVAFLFDYGVTRREYYAPGRSDGWLRCHYRHRAHNNPLILPGIQDLTAWVDFSSILL